MKCDVDWNRDLKKWVVSCVREDWKHSEGEGETHVYTTSTYTHKYLNSALEGFSRSYPHLDRVMHRHIEEEFGDAD